MESDAGFISYKLKAEIGCRLLNAPLLQKLSACVDYHAANFLQHFYDVR